MTFMTDGDGGMGGDGAGAPQADPMQNPGGGAVPGAGNQPPQAPQQ